MWRFKIYFKFIIWLLKQLLYFPMKFLAYTHVYIDTWKNECRDEFPLAMLYYALTVASSMAGGLVSILIMYGDDTTKEQLKNSLATSFYFATGVFIFVILLASYDKFIEEYEQSFNKLKE